MSMRRSVILSVVLEGRSQAETARLYGMSEATVSRWIARYRADGEAAFEPRSRKPKTSPTRLAHVVITQIVNLRDQLTEAGLDAGPATIAWHLNQAGVDPVPSIATIRRHLIAAGRITPEPKKRPKSSYIRFEADLPNEMWQTDACTWHLRAGVAVEILSWLDDHSRYATGVTAHPSINSPVVIAAFEQACNANGLPASVLSDNAMYYTARFARGGRSGPNRFETHLHTLGITQKHSRPNHPTTCGKVERFQQTLKKWLHKQPRAGSIAELQTQLNDFTYIYNHTRPHRSINTTPATAYTRLPKTGPTGTDAPYRIRHDRVDQTGGITIRRNGTMHRIGIGRAHKHQPVIALIHDLDIRIIHRETGELLRQLTIDPTRRYQPQNPRT